MCQAKSRGVARGTDRPRRRQRAVVIASPKKDEGRDSPSGISGVPAGDHPRRIAREQAHLFVPDDVALDDADTGARVHRFVPVGRLERRCRLAGRGQYDCRHRERHEKPERDRDPEHPLHGALPGSRRRQMPPGPGTRPVIGRPGSPEPSRAGRRSQPDSAIPHHAASLSGPSEATSLGAPRVALRGDPRGRRGPTSPFWSVARGGPETSPTWARLRFGA